MDPEPPAAGLRVLVIDDEANIRKTLSLCLELDGHDVIAVSNSPDALAEAARRPFDLAFLDLRLGTGSGLDAIPGLIAASPWIKIVVITAYAAVDTAVDAMKRGAMDYLSKPFTPEQVRDIARRVARMRGWEGEPGRSPAEGDAALEADLHSRSPAMERAYRLAREVAAIDGGALIRGESGTGKGVLARAIHAWSPRADKPFAVLACPSLSAELVESELFGHAKGAFTGALRDSPGRVGAAEGGTLFLDEIGDLPLSLQPKLLRFLQDREYERVGEARTRKADIRILAATNVDLEKAMAGGRFREDLYYRLNAFPIDLPPLRERPEDIEPLALRFLADFNRRHPGACPGFGESAWGILRRYAWPGNLRELKNVVERAALLCRGREASAEDLPPKLVEAARGAVAAPAEVGGAVSLDRLEEAHIRRILAATKSLEEAARVLGIDAATLWRRRKKYGI